MQKRNKPTAPANKKEAMKQDVKMFLNQCEDLVPQYEERLNKRLGVYNWGKDNLFPDYLISLYNRNTKHRGIINDKAKMVGGQGFEKEGLADSTLAFIANSLNPDRETLDEIVSALALDYEIFNCIALLVLKHKGGGFSLQYVKVGNTRLTPLDEKGEQFVEYRHNWGNARMCEPVVYPLFNPDDIADASIMFIAERGPDSENYGVPQYIPAAVWIEAQDQIATLHLAQLQNSYQPSMHISMHNGIPSEEEREEVLDQFQKNYASARNGGAGIITFSADKDSAPVFTPIHSNDNDKKYVEIDGMADDKINQAHRVKNPALFGEKTPGELGGSNEALQALALFQSTYVEDRQMFIERAINWIGETVFNLTEEIHLAKYVLKLDAEIDIDQMMMILTSTLPNAMKSLLLQDAGYPKDKADAIVYAKDEEQTQTPTNNKPQ